MKNVAARLATTLCIAFASNATFAGEETIRLKEAPGSDLTSARCAICHSLDYIEINAAVMDLTAWEKSVRKMIDRFGAPIGEEDAAVIVEYLAANYSSAPEHD